MLDTMRIKLWGVRGSLPTPMGAPEYQEILGEALAIAAQIHRSNPSCNATQILESIPERYRQVIGGETTCVEVNAADTVIMMDAGTGARRAGQDMASRGIKEVHILITHTHWDHIQGFPFLRRRITQTLHCISTPASRTWKHDSPRSTTLTTS
jgi:glyoxylase-like metal-dependent hydrolase (beta-lactamase superfamily II)